jgi:hypothetical protein
MAQGARSSKGVKIEMINPASAGDDISADVDSVSAAKPAVLVGTGFTVTPGSLVYVTGTGVSAIDNQYWPAGPNTNATGIELLGSDNSAGGTTLDAGFEVLAFGAGDLVDLCLASLEISRDVPATIDVSNFCDLSATVASAKVAAGTIAISGWIDITSDDYNAILAADLDGAKRTFLITLPDNGYLLATGTIGGLVWSVPIDGALGYNATITLSTSPKHRY